MIVRSAAQTELERWFNLFFEAWHSGNFVRCTLSRPSDSAPVGLRNIYLRLVSLKDGERLGATFRHASREECRNLTRDEAAELLPLWIGKWFEDAVLFTTDSDYALKRRASGSHLRRTRPTFSAPPNASHDRVKQRRVCDAPCFADLGLLNSSGQLRTDKAGKLRQVERFIELLGHALDGISCAAGSTFRVLDLGAGKGYLTFAMAEYLMRAGFQPEVTAIEVREDLVADGNALATRHGYSVRFVPGTIGSFALPDGAPPHALVALHACNTATDDALALGVRCQAPLILAAPCCHKEVREQLQVPDDRADLLRHGILAEREAELLTDGLRALLMELSGYDCRIIEFVAGEHTAKNLLLVAKRRKNPPDERQLMGMRARLHALCTQYGLTQLRLASVLGIALTDDTASMYA